MGAWSRAPEAVLTETRSSATGLTTSEAAARVDPRRALRPSRRSLARLLAGQFLNPLVLLLLVAAAISFPLGEHVDGWVIVGIVLLSGGLGLVQEYVAEDTVTRLLATVQTRARVRRDGEVREVPAASVVVGDILVLSAGSTVQADARLLSANGLQVDESALTGESFPAAKDVAPVPEDAPPARRGSVVFLGTHVVSGTADAVVFAVGGDTALGEVSRSLSRPRPPTAFDLGLSRFGRLLVTVSAALVLVIFAVNIGLARPALDAFLFAVALAVGLVPELLPAIVTVNLARGARRMAAAHVVVKRLAAIEDFGSIDTLCSDKTGTLTTGKIRLSEALDPTGEPCAHTRELGWLNAHFESGYDNPIDAALRDALPGRPDGWRRVAEVPYDFTRRRLSVLLEHDGRRWLVTKGQLDRVLECCSTVGTGAFGEAPVSSLDEARDRIGALHGRLAEAGSRVLGVAVRPFEGEVVDPSSETGMVFVGVLAFADPPRPDAAAVIDELAGLGIGLRLVTGDDRRVATHLWQTLRGQPPRILTGGEIRQLRAEALERRVLDTDVFAEVDPNQKERLVAALRHAGHRVAYMGDGINDAPALRAADVGVSVDTAADVAREAADVVLRERDLGVVAAGVREGRRTMAATLTYVRYTTSANFGNMLSMAVASIFLPFLPLLPKQILLNNFLSDLPALAIAGDRVDSSTLARPGRWSTSEIQRFMFVFGAISSAFDLTTFWVLLELSGRDPARFRTGWFVESLLTELLVLLVLRSPLPLGKSRPAPGVLWLTVGVALLALALPFTPLAVWFGLVPLSPTLLSAVLGITIAYLGCTELAKRRFFREEPAERAPRRRMHT